jgi:hypothetical protein
LTEPVDVCARIAGPPKVVTAQNTRPKTALKVSFVVFKIKPPG